MEIPFEISEIHRQAAYIAGLEEGSAYEMEVLKARLESWQLVLQQVQQKELATSTALRVSTSVANLQRVQNHAGILGFEQFKALLLGAVQAL